MQSGLLFRLFSLTTYVLSSAYNPQIESQFLSIVSALILRSSEGAPSFSTPLFQEAEQNLEPLDLSGSINTFESASATVPLFSLPKIERLSSTSVNEASVGSIPPTLTQHLDERSMQITEEIQGYAY